MWNGSLWHEAGIAAFVLGGIAALNLMMFVLDRRLKQ